MRNVLLFDYFSKFVKKFLCYFFHNQASKDHLTLSRMGRRGGEGEGVSKKPPPTSFSFVTSANGEVSPRNFLTFSFNPFSILVQNFKSVPSASPYILSLNQDQSSKNHFFWSSRYKIEVMITSFTEMLELPNFGHMKTFTI